MTLKDIQAEIREEFYKKLDDNSVYVDGMSWLNTALDRVAEETKKAIVPPREAPDGFNLEAMARGGVPTSARLRPEQHGHNSCRSQMEANYQSFTQEV
jgi:hypothetical protein